MGHETATWGFPITDGAVLRTSLIASISARPSTVKILAAPSGFGKTIAAAQYARLTGFDQAIWVDGSSGLSQGSQLLAQVVEAVLSASEQASQPLTEVGPVGLGDLMGALEHFVSLRQSVCVVVDDVALRPIDADPTQIVVLERALRAAGGCLLLTTRDVCTIPGLEHAQYYEADDLRLSLGEALQIAERIAGGTPDSEAVESCWRDSAGSAAFLAVLLRAHNLPEEQAGGGRQLLDLEGLLDRVVSTHLDELDRRTLSAMGMMGTGTEDELQAVGVDPGSVRRIARVVPLVTFGSSDNQTTFQVHDILQTSVLNLGAAMPYQRELAPRVLDQLVQKGHLSRALGIVSRFYDGIRRKEWLERHGGDAISAGCGSQVRTLLAGLSLRELIERPRLLLLQATLLFAAGALDEACTKARVVSSMASSAGDRRLAVDALRLTAAIQNDGGRMGEARESLLELATVYSDVMTPEERAHTYASLGTVFMYAGDVQATRKWMKQADDTLRLAGMRLSAAGILANKGACVALVSGEHSWTAKFFSDVAAASDTDWLTKTVALGNAAASMCEIGRLDRCLESVRGALEHSSRLGLPDAYAAFLPIAGAAKVALGDDTGLMDMGRAVGAADRHDFQSGADYNRIYYSTCLRASGRAEDSLDQAERAFEGLQRDGLGLLGELAQLEVGASMLALRDSVSALRLVALALQDIDPLNHYHQLRAAMILAQIDVLEGDVGSATDRLRPFRDYVLTGSSNWQIAMYVRAFPELIAPLAGAMGVANLPIRLLRMVLPENAERSLSSTHDLMAEEEWVALGKRLLGDDEFEKWIEREGRPLCRVRMFGGFEVAIGPRPITERDWKKRKARALFAILASQNGHPITRDQLCDRLWPDMDDARAKNNLYVAWSVMKSALLGPEGKGEECPYVEAVGGLCRTVDEVVRTDVDEFDRLVAEAKTAAAAGNDQGAVLSYERLADVYRGELLPSDLYDDSFQALRDRYRHEFCDAMARGAGLALTQGDTATALQFARRGLGSDPFREDLYQAALRAQILAGQRSAAIETYFECRSRLIEELGLDPSAETRALYDEILALEDRTTQRQRWRNWLSEVDD